MSSFNLSTLCFHIFMSLFSFLSLQYTLLGGRNAALCILATPPSPAVSSLSRCSLPVWGPSALFQHRWENQHVLQLQCQWCGRVVTAGKTFFSRCLVLTISCPHVLFVKYYHFNHVQVYSFLDTVFLDISHIVVQSLPPFNSRSFSSSKTETICPVNSNSPFPAHPRLSNHHSAFCLYESLLQVPLISGIIQYLSSRDWLISLRKRFIHVVAYSRSSFLFKTK